MNFTENPAASRTPIYRNYKDRVFRMLFRDKKSLLALYNALNGTDYTNEDDLIFNTLENAIFIKMKNDISFIIGCDMCLYEHQASYCPNMPLRGFLYFADLYKKFIGCLDLSVRRQIKIPAPRYVVFYNGVGEEREEFTQKLSDAFEYGSDGCMELTVRVININYGHNKELMEKCQVLKGYAQFVSIVRKNLSHMELKEAAEKAVDECIEKNILKDFLLEQKSEVVAMSIYEYNEEYVRKTFYEDGMTEGYENGHADGYENGHADGYENGRLLTLMQAVENTMEHLGINLEEACQVLGTSVMEYKRAKTREP